MPRQAKKQPVETKIRKRAEAPAEPVVAETIPPAPQEQAGGQSQSPVLDVLQRMETLLGERIDRTREKLRSTEEAVSNLRDRERQADALEAEIKDLRKSAKALEIRASQLDAENAGLRNSLASLRETVAGLETAKRAAENRATLLQAVVQRVHQVAALEIGRAVKALLGGRKGGLWKKETPVSAHAKLLVDTRIVDPEWYLQRHVDVAAAGMEPALHYILHGAEEGRVPGPALDEAARESGA